LFEPGGERYALLSSTALTAVAIPDTSRTTSDIDVQLISVYPNPAKDIITVSATDQNVIGSNIEMYNQVGQKIISQRISQLQFQINVGALNTGVYFVTINDGISKHVTKLVKL